MNIVIILKGFLLLFTLINCSDVLREQRELEEEYDTFVISECELGCYKYFGMDYLNMKVPARLSEAEVFSSSLKSLISALIPRIWKLGSNVNGLDVPHYIESLKTILEEYPQLHCQALRRCLIYGLLSRFDYLVHKFKDYPRIWRFLSTLIADAILVVDSIIPEVFFELNEAFSQDSGRFTEHMNIFVAKSFEYDFYPMFRSLKELKYSEPDNFRPLALLIKYQRYTAASKMILMGEGRLHPEKNTPAWLTLIDAPDCKAKFRFISVLLQNDQIDLNWKLQGLDFLQLAIKSKMNLLETVTKILSLNNHKMEQPVSFYLTFARSPEVVRIHSPDYHRALVDRIISFITTKAESV